MAETISKPRKWGWMVLDFLGGMTLMLGLLTVFVPEVAVDFGVPLAWGWPLIVIGGGAMLLAMMMFFRQLRARRDG